MRYVQLTGRVDSGDAPECINLLAHHPDVEEARILAINTTLDGTETFLFGIDGDPDPFAERATDTPGIESIELSETVQNRTYALVVMRPMETPMFSTFHEAAAIPGLVVRPPIVYRDGHMYGHAIGTAEALQYAMEHAPDDIDVRVDSVTEYRGQLDEPQAALSDRQAAALDVALELGYYEHPREATQVDVAEALDCAAPTASEHLRKAESKVLEKVLGTDGPPR